MTIKNFLFGIAIATLICFLGWFAVLALSDPVSAGISGLALFYFSLFLWLSGFFILAGFYFRHYSAPRKTPFTALSNSLRQAIIFASAIDAALILKSMQMLNLLNLGFLIISIVAIEAYYLNFNHGHLRRNR